MNLPDTYFDCVSLSQAVKISGNGWDVGMFKHIFNQMAAIADKEGGKEKTIKTGKQHEDNNREQNGPCNIYGVSNCGSIPFYAEPTDDMLDNFDRFD